MREIVFRGRAVETGKWYYGSLIMLGENDFYICPLLDGPTTLSRYAVVKFNMIMVDPATVGQYTDLDDMARNMIFEDDILSAHLDERYPENETRSLVSWDNVNMCWGMQENLYSIDPMSVDDSDEWTVIGNIHDNPELMEV